MQVIPPTFAAYAGPYRGLGIFNPLANIYAGLNYAIHRYGASWTQVLGHGHGYDSGGYLPTGLSLAYNGTGRPEQVIPHGRGHGSTIIIQNLNVNLPHGADREQGRRIVESIRKYEAGSGSGWRR
jgi:SLT domain-containing protein